MQFRPIFDQLDIIAASEFLRFHAPSLLSISTLALSTEHVSRRKQ